MATDTVPRELMEVAGARYGTLALPAKATWYIAGRDKANKLNEELRTDLPESFQEAATLFMQNAKQEWEEATGMMLLNSCQETKHQKATANQKAITP